MLQSLISVSPGLSLTACHTPIMRLVAAGILVLTDFGACPLVEPCLPADRLAQRRRSLRRRNDLERDLRID